MKIATESKLVRRALSVVKRRVPKRDWEQVDSFIKVVRTTSSWNLLLASGVDTTAGLTSPIYDMERDLGEQEAGIPDCHVLFSLPVCRYFTQKALIGIVAHEFAHGLRASRLGKGWHAKMKSRWAAEERIADGIASKWGFGENIKAMRFERIHTVNPLLANREPQIVRSIERRMTQVPI